MSSLNKIGYLPVILMPVVESQTGKSVLVTDFRTRSLVIPEI
jgi:hypothetical protein